jgi:hypothetical protein
MSLASFGDLPILPMASFGAENGGLGSFGALPILPMASFGAVELASFGARPASLTIGYRVRRDPDCQGAAETRSPNLIIAASRRDGL